MNELEHFKSVHIESVKLAAKNKITSVYPIEKQLNILRLGSGFTQQDLDQMNEFIDGIRAQTILFEDQINNATLDQIKIFNFSNEVF